jgi:type II secretory pathway component GspD/PulD (secretin)
MKSNLMITAGVVWLSVLVAFAQEKPAPQSAQEKPAQPAAASGTAAQVKVTVLISRYQGDKRLTSLPYVFGTTSGTRTNLRMGSDVPVVVTRAQKTGTGDMAPAAFNYRPVGTNIDCILSGPAGGPYTLQLTIEDSSVELAADGKQGSAVLVSDIPSFRSFKTNFTAAMRDGQTLQHTAATDPVTGEVTRIDLTVNAMK